MADYTILVADYDPATTKIATSTFEAAGFDVHVAKDGLAAVEAFKKLRPVLTLIEFMMPKKAGLEVCRELRHSAEGREAPLVVMSSPFRGRAFRTDAVRVYGATETVEKPLDREKLDSLIERLVRPRVEQLVAAVEAPAAAPPRPAPRAVPSPAPPVPNAAPSAQDRLTAQALRDVVSAVLGSAGIGDAEAKAEVEVEAAPPNGKNGQVQPASAPVSVREETADDAEIEDHIDSLLDF